MPRLTLLPRLGVLAVALALAPLSTVSAQITFDNGCPSSDWNCAANWNPDGVPGQGDDVFIGGFNVTGTFAAGDLASLTLNGTTLNTDGSLTVGQLDWSGGISNINAGATITINGNGSVWSGASKVLSSVTFTISPGVTVTNSGSPIFLQNGTVLQNFGTLDLQNDGSLMYTTGVEPEFVNAGTIRKTNGTGTSEFIPPITNNDGLIDVDQGTLRFGRGGTLNGGTYNAETGATLLFDFGTFTTSGTLTGTADGFIGHDNLATLTTATTTTLDFALDGSGYQWSSGNLSAPGAGLFTNVGLLRFTDAFPGTNGLVGDNTAGDVVLRNEGMLIHESGTLSMQSGSVLQNLGTYDLQGTLPTIPIVNSSGVASEFANLGTFRKGAGTATSSINVSFTNAAGATVLANEGLLDFFVPPFVNEVGATIGGDGGTISPTPTNPYVNNGIIAPGASTGLLTWQGDLDLSSSSRFVAEIGGGNPPVVGDDYDRLAVTGDLSLGGTLEVAIAVGDAPAVGDTYTILTADGELVNAFATIEGPSGYTFGTIIDGAADEVRIEVLTVPNFDLVATNTNPTGDPIVVAKPGAIDFAYAVTNNTNASITGDVFFTASLGSNVLAQGVILSGTLPANTSSPALSFTQGVPGIAPNGTYTYSIKIGQFPSTVVDQVDFAVQVTSAARPGEEGDASESWSVREATPWLGADGSVLMAAAKQDGVAVETEETADAAVTAVPEAFDLAAAYPNPFRLSTTFALDLPEAGRVTVAVYDALGRRVVALLDEEVDAGTHRVAFDASSLPSGVYLVRATGAGANAMQRVTLMR